MDHEANAKKKVFQDILNKTSVWKWAIQALSSAIELQVWLDWKHVELKGKNVKIVQTYERENLKYEQKSEWKCKKKKCMKHTFKRITSEYTSTQGDQNNEQNAWVVWI